jgi:hypothetical protein
LADQLEVPPCEQSETSDSIEVQRCRRAQYSGHPKALTLGGSKISGFDQSVKEDRSWRAKMDCHDHCKGRSPLPFVSDIIRSPNDHDGRRPISQNSLRACFACGTIRSATA